MKVLRIVFCVLSCLCVAAVVPVAVFYEWWCFLCVAGAVAFGGLMFLAIRLSTPKVTPTDFMNSDEENAEILRKREEDKKE